MKIYEPGNAAKQAIFLQLEQSLGQEARYILDLACGDGHLWKTFLEAHPQVSVVGLDSDAQAIERGKKQAPARLDLRVFDAQQMFEDRLFDVVVAFSAVEHVVDRPAFLRTVWKALKPGGYAYLNYDVGHFRSRSLKERAMVPVSQFLALMGIEGPYMKRVDDVLFLKQARSQGFGLQAVQKHNLHPLKGFFRGATDEGISAWLEFEQRMNALFSPEQLDQIMWSTTVILKKP
ncbi:class I SAM-dependent methyltransferase [Patescibacteria group bacterium]|nr:class I SAM-dependent methyltransferase [Patescibacteria group bacterium]MBP9709686.1 class I SAM-dependent methyltransferase [Patescibacteria group bacterium]